MSEERKIGEAYVELTLRDHQFYRALNRAQAALRGLQGVGRGMPGGGVPPGGPAGPAGPGAGMGFPGRAGGGFGRASKTDMLIDRWHRREQKDREKYLQNFAKNIEKRHDIIDKFARDDLKRTAKYEQSKNKIIDKWLAREYKDRIKYENKKQAEAKRAQAKQQADAKRAAAAAQANARRAAQQRARVQAAAQRQRDIQKRQADAQRRARDAERRRRAAKRKKFYKDTKRKVRRFGRGVIRTGLGYLGMAGGLAAAAGIAYSATRAIRAMTQAEEMEVDLQRIMGIAEGRAKDLVESLQKRSMVMPGISLEDLYKTTLIGAKGGIENLSALSAFVADMTKFSSVLGSESHLFEEFTERIMSLATIFNKGYESAGRFASAVLALDAASIATARDILDVSNRMAPAMALFNVPASETLAIAAALRQAKIPIETAGTSMGQVVMRMASSRDAGEFAKLAGVDTQTFKAMLASGRLLEIWAGISKSLNAMDPVAQSRALDRLHLDGQRVRMTMIGLAKVLDELNEYVDISKKNFKTQQFLQDSYIKRAETTNAQITLMINNLSSMASVLKAVVLPTIKGISEGASILAAATREGFKKQEFQLSSIGERNREILRGVGIGLTQPGYLSELVWKRFKYSGIQAIEAIKAAIEGLFDFIVDLGSKVIKRLKFDFGSFLVAAFKDIPLLSKIADVGQLMKISNAGMNFGAFQLPPDVKPNFNLLGSKFKDFWGRPAVKQAGEDWKEVLERHRKEANPLALRLSTMLLGDRITKMLLDSKWIDTGQKQGVAAAFDPLTGEPIAEQLGMEGMLGGMAGMPGFAGGPAGTIATPSKRGAYVLATTNKRKLARERWRFNIGNILRGQKNSQLKQALDAFSNFRKNMSAITEVLPPIQRTVGLGALALNKPLALSPFGFLNVVSSYIKGFNEIASTVGGALGQGIMGQTFPGLTPLEILAAENKRRRGAFNAGFAARREQINNAMRQRMPFSHFMLARYGLGGQLAAPGGFIMPQPKIEKVAEDEFDVLTKILSVLKQIATHGLIGKWN